MSLKIENSTEIIILIVFLFFVIYLLNCNKLKEGIGKRIQQYRWQELCPSPKLITHSDNLSDPCDIYKKSVYSNDKLNIFNLDTIASDDIEDSDCRNLLKKTKCDGDRATLQNILANYNNCYNNNKDEGTHYTYSPSCDKDLFCETLRKFGRGEPNLYFNCPSPTPTPTSV